MINKHIRIRRIIMPHFQVIFIRDQLADLRIGNVPRLLRAAARFRGRVEPVAFKQTIGLRAVLEGHEEGAAVAGFADEDLVAGDAGFCDWIIEKKVRASDMDLASWVF
jgi:hypothetical protein